MSHARYPARLLATSLAGVLVACAPRPPVTPPGSPVTSTTAPTVSPVEISPLPQATPEGLSEALREALGAPGAIAVANVEPESFGWWRLTINVVRLGQPVTSGSVRFRGDGWSPHGNDHPGDEDPFDILTGSVQLTRDGWAAIEVEAVDTNDHFGRPLPENGTVVIDLVGDRGTSPVIPGGSPIWLPDGTLLLSGGVPLAFGQYGLRRVRDHGFGRTVDLVIKGAEPLYPLNFIVHGDLSGIQAWTEDGHGWGGVVVKWDGTLVSRTRKDPPYLALGVERTAGSDGAFVVGCKDWGPCALEWQRPGGRVLAHPSIDVEHAWTRDGTALVVLDGAEPNVLDDERVLLIHDSKAGLVTEPLARPLPGELDAGLFFFRGMTDWAVALERDQDLHVNVYPLDGSPVIGPIVGTVALVNP